MTTINQYTVAALYDGGWRSADFDELKIAYEMTEEEASSICEALSIIEADNTLKSINKNLYNSIKNQ